MLLWQTDNDKVLLIAFVQPSFQVDKINFAPYENLINTAYDENSSMLISDKKWSF